jgi:hypothetical protein
MLGKLKIKRIAYFIMFSIGFLLFYKPSSSSKARSDSLKFSS